MGATTKPRRTTTATKITRSGISLGAEQKVQLIGELKWILKVAMQIRLINQFWSALRGPEINIEIGIFKESHNRFFEQNLSISGHRFGIQTAKDSEVTNHARMHSMKLPNCSQMTTKR
jgi:hypothetical protein